MKGPSKVHFDGTNSVAAKGKKFGVSSPVATTNIRHFVSHDHFVTGLDGPNEVELLALPSAWPAAIEVARAIKSDIEWAGKRELVGEGALDHLAIARREGAVEVVYDFLSARHPVPRPPGHYKC